MTAMTDIEAQALRHWQQEDYPAVGALLQQALIDAGFHSVVGTPHGVTFVYVGSEPITLEDIDRNDKVRWAVVLSKANLTFNKLPTYRVYITVADGGVQYIATNCTISGVVSVISEGAALTTQE